MRLIDAEELERLFNEQIEQGVGVIDAFDAFDDALQDTPTVDAVPVVRCKNCTSGTMSDDNKYIICCRLGVGMEFDDFCSSGERKEGAEC